MKRIFAILVIATVLFAPTVVFGQIPDPAPAQVDTVTIGLPSITLPHSLVVTLMVVFGSLLALSEFFGLRKKIAVNSVWEWLFKIVTSFVESLKNAHQGTPPTDPPGGPSATK